MVQEPVSAQPWAATLHTHAPEGLGRSAPGHHTGVETSRGNVEEAGMETQATPHAPAARPGASMGVAGDRARQVIV